MIPLTRSERPAAPRRASHRARAFCAELLEDRIALTVYTVTNTNDIGPGSLRQAILNANSFISDDTIVFDAFFSVPRVIDVIAPLPQFSGGLTIVGPGSSLLTVRKTEFGPAVYRRVFDSFSPRLTLSGMTLTGGNLIGAHGAGLSCTSASNVTLDDMVITGNTANTNDGGGIWLSNNATLTLRNSLVTNNIARRGGGISYFDGGSLVMDTSTVSGNTSIGTSGRDVSGGGIYFAGAAVANPPAGFIPDTLLIRNSTISNNRAAGGGGGFGSENFTGTLLVRNSTVSGNVAATSGGGILQNAAPVTLTIEDSTITNNSAGGTATGTNATGGGGICRVTIYPGTLNITNSIVSGNSNPLTPDILTTNTTTNVRFSAIGSASGFTLAAGSGNNRPFGTNPMLGPLAPNGGPTFTHALLSGSSLINAGNNALVPSELTTDQRGPGFPRLVGTVDMGAYERTAAADPARITGVFVRSSAWQPVFLNYLAANALGDATVGYAIPDGPVQLNTLPWLTLDRVSLRFNKPVQIPNGALVVTGVSGVTYTVSPAIHDTGTMTATWIVTPAPSRDKVILKLDSDVISSAGALDGEWTSGVSSFPSGNGTVGGDFNFRLNYLAGDTTRDRVVLAQDYSDVKKKFFKDTASPVTGADTDYSPFHDIDGSGVILAFDYSEVKKRFFESLPGPEPTAVLAAPAAGDNGGAYIPFRRSPGIGAPVIAPS